MAKKRLRLGVSACLLGRKVRYDGRHKRSALLLDALGPFVEWVEVCPELELGMGVPREPIRLVAARAGPPRLVAERSGKDHTEAMARLAEARVRELAKLDLDGFVAKKDSPSCGMDGVRVHPARGGTPRRDGVGAFLRVLAARMPLLPIEEEGRLEDAALREGFVERLFAHARWKAAVVRGTRRVDLAAFHAAHELTLLSHSPAAYRRLGALVVGHVKGSVPAMVAAYGRGFMEALRIPATRGRHASVLTRAMGELREVLPPADRIELARCVEDYARGAVPLLVPLTLLRHHARSGGVAHLAGQTYLDPDPMELMLRNHA